MGNLGKTEEARKIMEGKARPPRAVDKSFIKLMPHLVKSELIKDAKMWTTEELAYRWS